MGSKYTPFGSADNIAKALSKAQSTYDEIASKLMTDREQVNRYKAIISAQPQLDWRGRPKVKQRFGGATFTFQEFLNAKEGARRGLISKIRSMKP